VSQFATRNPKPETRNPKPEILNRFASHLLTCTKWYDKPRELNPKPKPSLTHSTAKVVRQTERHLASQQGWGLGFRIEGLGCQCCRTPCPGCEGRGWRIGLGGEATQHMLMPQGILLRFLA
jgi:hypothetical protein